MDGARINGACNQSPIEEPPRSVRIMGRRREQDNGDICGEYFHRGFHGGYPAYVNHVGVAIRYDGHSTRWVIDRGGIRNADVCVAYADGPTTNHPGYPDLMWHVWEEAARAYLPDVNLFVVDAPDYISFVGRNQATNGSVNGKYSLVGVIHGKAAYQHETSEFIIRYDLEDRRWSLERRNFDNACMAWADDARNLNHPGDPGLQWHFWEHERQAFLADLNAAAVTSPEVVHMFGPSSQAEAINGAYHLIAVYCGHPMYSKLGTQMVIRYSPQRDNWLIDPDGLSKPSMLSRMYQFVLSGVRSEPTSEKCVAYAAARGSEHPGKIELEWHVWNSLAGQFRLEPLVMSTSAPLRIEFRGRAAGRDNCDILGEYGLAGATNGFPMYEQVGTRTAIYHSRLSNRWLVDRQGVREIECCVASAEANGGEHPADSVQFWSVYEASRATFVPDPSLSVEALAEAPVRLARTSDNGGGLAPAFIPAHALKRPYSLDDEFGRGMPCPPSKMSRLGNQSGDSRWYRSFGA